MAGNNSKTLLIVAISIAIGAAGYAAMTMKDQRTTGQKIGDAIDALPGGLDKAARQLDDRTPAEKMGDAIKDEKDKIEGNTNQ